MSFKLTQKPKSSSDELAVISRLIHTTTCFEQILDNIYFSPDALHKIKDLLLNKAKIIVDVNMIKVGLSKFYLDTYGNEVYAISMSLLLTNMPKSIKPLEVTLLW